MTRLLLSAIAVIATTAARADGQVTALADLQFGTVIAGVPESVAPTSSDAGRYRIHYTVLAIASSFQLTLPTQLSRVGGAATMPVSFCSTCGIYRLNNSNPSGGTTFNPANSVSLPLLVINSDVYIWLGGTVSPATNQTPGSYTGSAVLTLSGVTL